MQPQANQKPPADFSDDPQYQQFLAWQAQSGSPQPGDNPDDAQRQQFQQFEQFQQWQKAQVLQKLESQLGQLQQLRTHQPAPAQSQPQPTSDPYQQIMTMAQPATHKATATRRLPIALIVMVAIIALLISGILYLIFGLPHANLVVVSYQNYSSSSDDLHFIGLLKNTGNGDANNITVKAVLKDSKGRQDGDGDDSSLFGAKLAPGQQVGFDISIALPPTKWASVEFSTSTEDTNLTPAAGIVISSSAIARNENGYAITGTVQDSGQNDVGQAHIILTGYDAAGKVVAVANGYSDTRDGIDSGQSDSFEVDVYNTDIKIDHYETFVFADAK